MNKMKQEKKVQKKGQTEKRNSKEPSRKNSHADTPRSQAGQKKPIPKKADDQKTQRKPIGKIREPNKKDGFSKRRSDGESRIKKKPLSHDIVPKTAPERRQSKQKVPDGKKFDRSLLKREDLLKKVPPTPKGKGSQKHDKRKAKKGKIVKPQKDESGLELRDRVFNPYVKVRNQEPMFDTELNIQGKSPKSAKSLSQHKFRQINSENMTHVNTILNNIEPRIREVLAKNDYLIYQIYNEQTYNRDLYLVNNSLVPLIKQLKEHTSLNHSGIYFGHLVQGYSKSNIKMEKRFNLSLEGGSFLYSLIQSKYPEIFANLPILKVNTEGEKKFLYGNNLEATDIYQVNDRFKKYTPIFVVDEYDEYLGLCLLMVKQAGSERSKKINERLNEIEYLKKRKNYHEGDYTETIRIDTPDIGISDSKNFIVKFVNLTDLGKYLRGSKK